MNEIETKKINKLVVDRIENVYTGVRHGAEVIVFVPEKRPFDEGNVKEDFIWRRTHPQPYKVEVIKEAIKEKMDELGKKIRKIEYNRNAGCGMCPCSPGYVIYTGLRMYNNQGRIAIWLKEVSESEREE